MLLVALVPAVLLPGMIATGVSKDYINQQMLAQVHSFSNTPLSCAANTHNCDGGLFLTFSAE